MRNPLATGFERKDALLQRFKALIDLGGGISTKHAFAVDGLTQVVDTRSEIVDLGVTRRKPPVELLVHRSDCCTDITEYAERLVFRIGHMSSSPMNIGGRMLQIKRAT